MRKVKVVTDSTCDLSPKLVAEYGLTVVPLYVRFGEEIYRDGVDLDNRKLFQKVAELGRLPQTAAPTPDDFLQVFKRLLDEDGDVVYVGLSSHLSATMQSAAIAAGECPSGRVAVVDGLNLSSGTGILAIMAVDLAAQGIPGQEITGIIQSRVQDLRTMFIIDTLEYLHKGGRCSSIQSLLAGVLKIHPLLIVEDGKIIIKEKVRGSDKKMLDRMLQQLEHDGEQIDPKYIGVTGAACPEELQRLLAGVKEAFPATRILVNEAGSVISSHCGPKTLGLFYLLKNQALTAKVV